MTNPQGHPDRTSPLKGPTYSPQQVRRARAKGRLGLLLAILALAALFLAFKILGGGPIQVWLIPALIASVGVALWARARERGRQHYGE